ncbi:MAG: four helix bundle protein, partial [Snowella sp.]
KELDVWQRSIDLVVWVYRLAKLFPKHEQYSLISQVQRAVTSIPANIAEGWGRSSRKEYIYHLTVARGSLMEVETHLIVAQRLDYISSADLQEVQEEITIIGKMLNRLISSLRT